MDPSAPLRWSHRKFRDVLRWLDAQWNEPDRHDYYVMQQSAILLQANGTSARPGDLKLPFEWTTPDSLAGPGDPWADFTNPAHSDEKGNPVDEDGRPIEQGHRRPELNIPFSPRIAAAGGKVRVEQADGTLRLYDVFKGKYVDE